jgi:O-antigen ligase
MIMHVAIVALSATKWLRTSIIVGLLVLIPVGYMIARTTGMFTGETLLDFASMIEPTRAESLQFRLDAELGIIRNAMEKPWFGYGSDPLWRARLSDDPRAKENVVTDGMWIIALGQGGLIALAALAAVLLLPPLLVWRRMPVAFWEHPAFAPILVLAMLLICFMFDSLFNADANMLTLLVAGAVSSMAATLRPGRRVVAAQPAPSRVARVVGPQRSAQPSRRRPAYAS